MNFLEQNISYTVPVHTIAGLPDPDDAPFNATVMLFVYKGQSLPGR